MKNKSLIPAHGRPELKYDSLTPVLLVVWGLLFEGPVVDISAPWIV
jgi:hypothetical protein